MAQWIRHRPPKPRIVGSSPTVGNISFCAIFNIFCCIYKSLYQLLIMIFFKTLNINNIYKTSSHSVQCCCPSEMCYMISYLYFGNAKRKAKRSHKIAHYIYSRHLPQQVISELIIVSFKTGVSKDDKMTAMKTN